MKDYYQIMGVSPQADRLEIKRAFRKLAVQYHPDKNDTKKAEDKFKEIVLAYETLSNPTKREQYDLFRAHHSFFQRSTGRYESSPADRRYKRRGDTYYSRNDTRGATYKLMEQYVPYLRWVSWMGLVLIVLLAVDYVLPFHCSEERILTTEQVYGVTKNSRVIHEYGILFTDQGRSVTLLNKDIPHFKDQQFIRVCSTTLFSKEVFVSPEQGTYRVDVSLIYGNLFFTILALLVTSVLGLFVRSTIEFQFNFAVVSLILLIIVGYLIIV